MVKARKRAATGGKPAREPARERPAEVWNWHFFKPWQIDPAGVHDSFITPGARTLRTAKGCAVAIVSPLMGGKHARGYPAGTWGTSFTVQHGSRVWSGWVIAAGGGRATRFPDKEFGIELMRRLARRGAFGGA